MIECRVLGPVELTVDGMAPPAELMWRKNLALLIYVAFSPRGSRTRDHLMGLLWSDKPEPAARHSLRESLRVLRRSLGEESLRTKGESVALHDDAVRLDTARFLDYEAAGDLGAAAELVGGEFLEGFGVPDASAFEDWVAAEREVWRGRCVGTLVHHAESLLEEGAVVTAVDAALRARRLDSRSAIATRIMMKALALSGDRAQALQLFRDYSDQLKDLGAVPDREVEVLAARIRDEREWQLPQSVLQRTKGAQLKRPPLIGREDVLAPLLEAWRRCAERSTATVCLVDGDPGLGKTRLAEELVARARLDGAATVSLRAVQGDLAIPESGLLALGRGGLLHAAGVPAAPRDALAAFAAADPEWAERFGSPRDATKPLGVALSDVLRGGRAQ
jgi:DNA-binding SARP family transcriptional activator